MCSRFAVSALAILIAASPLVAAPLQSGRLGELHLERLGTEDGLSHGAIYVLAEDRQGFLWIGTPAGLDRFDGYETIRVATGLGPVTALLVDRRDRFWIGASSGLYQLDRITSAVTPVALETGLATDGVRALAEDRSGRVWVGLGPRLFVVDDRGAREVTFQRGDDEDPRALISGFGALEDGGLVAWLAELSPPRTTLLRLSQEGDEVQTAHPPAEWGRAGSGHVDSKGRVWLDPWHFAVPTDDGEWTYRALDDAPRTLLSSRICEDQGGRLWFASEEGLYLRSDERQPALHQSHGQSRSNWQQSQLISCLVDSGNRVWLGSLGGLFVWDPHRMPFVRLRHDPADPESLGGDPVSSLVERSDGKLWVGTYGAGLSLLDRSDGRARRWRHNPDSPNSLCDDRIWDLASAPDGGLWIGTEIGLCRMAPGAPRFVVQPVPGLPEGQPDARVKAIVQQTDGVLWIGTNFGLFRLDPRTGASKRLTVEPGELTNRQVGDLLLEEPSVLWIASTDGDLQRLDLRTERLDAYRLTDRGRPSPAAIYDIARDPLGRLWAGTEQGLASFDEAGGKFELLGLEGTLADSIIYSLLGDTGGQLWLGTGRGLARLDIATGFAEPFDLSDGIGSMEHNRHAALSLSDESMVFGGMNGLTLFRPRELVGDRRPPPVALTAVRVLSNDGERSLPTFQLESVELSPRDHALTVEVAALAFGQQSHSRYGYRLEGFDDNWLDAGAQRSVRYTNLPPGSYNLRIRASNRSGVWSEEVVSLAVRVRPAYWQTWLFRIGLAAMAALLLTLAYRLRVRHLMALQKMRLRIAGDLHDELGSELSGIALVASMLRSRGHLEAGDQERLAQVETTSHKVMQGLRDIVWYINPEHDTASSLAARMRVDAELLLGDRERVVAITVDDPDAPLPMDRRRHLFLAYRELLHNIARHAGDCSVKIRFELRSSTFELEVEDDGAGFDPAERSVGTGLSSLRHRAEQLGADLVVDSHPGGGARVRLVSK